MASTSLFTKELNQNLGDATNICTITVTGNTGKVGINLSIVQFSGLDRNYRVNVPFNATANATGERVWKRLVPYDKTEKFTNQNNWAVDILSVNNVTTLRLVRSRVGVPPASTTLKCKVVAYPSAGESVEIVDSQTTSSETTNDGIFDGAMITQIDGMVGVNTDSPNHVLDIMGNVNTSTLYKIGGNVVLASTALGNDVVDSNLTTLGNLSTLSVVGNVHLKGLLQDNTTGSAIYVNPSTGLLSYGTIESNNSLNGELETLDVTGNVRAGNLSTNVISSTAITGSTLNVSGNITAGNVSTNAVTATTVTTSSLSVTGNVTGNLRVVGETINVGNVEVRYPVDESKRWRWISSTDADGDFMQFETITGNAWIGVMRIDKPV